MSMSYALLNPVRLNGIGLGEIDPRIKVVAVKEHAPKLALTTANRGAMDGLRLTKRIRQSKQITITCKLWTKDKRTRAQLYDQLTAWADAGGMLTLGQREGQQLRVWCMSMPDLDGADWQADLPIQLIAYDPYWEAIDPVSVSYTATAGTTATKTLHPGGTAGSTLLEIEVTPTTGMTSLTVAVNGRTWALTDLGMAARSTLKIDYDEQGFLRMLVGTTSKLGCRSAASSDDLWLSQRQSNSITVTTDAPGLVTLRAREKWL